MGLAVLGRSSDRITIFKLISLFSNFGTINGEKVPLMASIVILHYEPLFYIVFLRRLAISIFSAIAEAISASETESTFLIIAAFITS
jgi:hypothetical protein